MKLNQMLVLYISVFVGSILGIALLPEFASQCATAANDSNIAGTVTATFVGDIMPMIWGALCLGGLAGALYKMFR